MEELTGPLQEVFKDLRQKWQEMNQQESFYSVFMGFIHAIDWTEPWICGILVTHVVLILLALFTRTRSTVQGTLFVICMSIVYFSENLNDLGRVHWEKFARQRYFDANGVFMSAVVSGPLLAVMFIVLINYLLAAANLMVEAKKRELRYKAKLRNKQAGKADGSLSESKKIK